MNRAMVIFCILLLGITACILSTPPTPTQITTIEATLPSSPTSTPIPPELSPTGKSSPTPTVQPQSTGTPSPTPTLLCESETASAFLSVSADNIKAGDVVKVTVTIKNEGCVDLGLPQYRLSMQAGEAQPVFTPEQPEPVVHYLAVSSGNSDSQEFELVAVGSGQVTLTGSVSYEVHLGYPGPAYWGSRQTEPVILVVAP